MNGSRGFPDESTKRQSWNHGQDVKTWMSGVREQSMQFVSHLVILTNEPGKIGWILLRGLTLIMNYLQIREISDFSPLTPSYRLHFRTWSRSLARWPQKSKYESGRGVRNSERRATCCNDAGSLPDYIAGWNIVQCQSSLQATIPWGTRRCIISSTPGWKSSSAWSLRTFPLMLPYVIISWGRLKDPQRWMWTSSSSKFERRMMIRRPTRSCWAFETAHCKGSRRQEHGSPWQVCHRLHDPWTTEHSSPEACCSSTWQGWWQELWWQGKQACRA